MHSITSTSPSHAEKKPSSRPDITSSEAPNLSLFFGFPTLRTNSRPVKKQAASFTNLSRHLITSNFHTIFATILAFSSLAVPPGLSISDFTCFEK